MENDNHTIKLKFKLKFKFKFKFKVKYKFKFKDGELWEGLMKKSYLSSFTMIDLWIYTVDLSDLTIIKMGKDPISSANLF